MNPTFTDKHRLEFKRIITICVLCKTFEPCYQNVSTPDQRRIRTHPANLTNSRILHKQRVVHSRLTCRVLTVRTFYAFFKLFRIIGFVSLTQQIFSSFYNRCLLNRISHILRRLSVNFKNKHDSIESKAHMPGQFR